MSLRAYQQAAQRSESPRDAEYRLFAQVTRALMDLQTTPRENFGAWIDVLHWNRRMWAALADDCSSPTNTLPEPVRAQIISLSLFVHRHSSHVMQKKGDLETLIDINRMMMQGLSGRPEAA